MTYEELLNEADDKGLIVKEKPLQSSDGRIHGNKIAIRKDIVTEKEKSCVLAEEIGHYETGYGDILSQDTISDIKQESRARVWAYDKQVGLLGIIKCYKHRCRNTYDMAEYLNVTEPFLKDALECYKQRYGMYVAIDQYLVYFEPTLIVVERK